ncbi:MAG: NADPH:quinone reductase [Myxococcales bacterium]
MRALVSRSASTPLAWAELPDRSLRPDEVRVQVTAAGVNPVDWKMRGFSLLSVAHAIVGPSGPFVPGVDFAGVVTEAGTAVEGLRPGDPVVGGTDFSRRQRGSYARVVQVRADQVAPLPPSVRLDEAACLPVAGVTAQSALFEVGGLDVGRNPEARVLILGASGGVGLFAIQLARTAGAAVVGVCSARNVDLVRRLGALPIDYGAGDPLAAAREHGPYDVVVDAVGSAAYPVGRCRALLSKGGVHVLVMPQPRDYLQLAVRRARTVLGRPTTASLAPLVEALAAGRLEVLVAERIPFDDAERAHQVSREGRVVGKLVLVA